MDGLSSSDLLEWCVRKAKRFANLGDYVVRYTIPLGAPIEAIPWENDPNHIDLFGDPEELKKYLDEDFCYKIERPNRQQRSG